MPYRVLVYSPCGHAGWTLCGCFSDLEDARMTSQGYGLDHLLSAVVKLQPDPPRLLVVEANVPRPANLVHAPGFRKVALAL